MKVLSRDSRVIFAGFALLFAGLALLAGLFVAGQARRAVILFEYEADRIAASLLDGFRESGAAVIGEIDPRVQAFGVYRLTGEPVAVFGSTPAVVAPEETARAFRYDPAAATLTLVRPIGASAAV